MRRPSVLIFINTFILVVLCGLMTRSLIVATRPAVATVISGAPLLRQAGDIESKALDNGTLLHAGDLVLTGDNDKVQLRWSDGTRCLVLPNSQLSVVRTNYDSLHHSISTQLALQAGRVLVRVADSLSAGSQFTVATPTTLTSVRGTIFSVAARAGVSSVEVYRGQVLVRGQSQVGASLQIVDGGQTVVSRSPGELEFAAYHADDFVREPAIALPELSVTGLPEVSTSAALLIDGQTENDGRVTINGYPAHRSTPGHFARWVVLKPGPNTFNITCTDRHDTQVSVTRVVTYTPIPGAAAAPPGAPPLIYDASR